MKTHLAGLAGLMLVAGLQGRAEAGETILRVSSGASNVTTFRLGADGVPKFTGKFLGLGSPAVMVFLP